MRRFVAIAFTVVLCTVLFLPTPALRGAIGVKEAVSQLVSSRVDVLRAGHPVLPDGFAKDPGIAPESIPVTPGDVLVLLGHNGAVTPSTGFIAPHGPDGYDLATYFPDGTDIDSVAGISGIVHKSRTMFLAGVFLGPTEPVDPAPPRLDVTDLADDLTITPLLNQTFHIGDGLTGEGDGDVQRFVVPAGATRLYLGFADGYDFIGPPGAYGDNDGEFGVVMQPFTGTVPDYDDLTIGALKVKLNFKKPGKDSITVKCVLPLGEGFDPMTQRLDLDVGGNEVGLIMAGNGKGSSPFGKAKLKYSKKTGLWTLTVKMKKGEFIPSFDNEGLIDETTKDEVRVLRVYIEIDGRTFIGLYVGNWSAKAGKTGKLR